MFVRNGKVTGSVLLSEVDGAAAASAKPKAERKGPSKASEQKPAADAAAPAKADAATKQEVSKSGEDKPRS